MKPDAYGSNALRETLGTSCINECIRDSQIGVADPVWRVDGGYPELRDSFEMEEQPHDLLSFILLYDTLRADVFPRHGHSELRVLQDAAKEAGAERR